MIGAVNNFGLYARAEKTMRELANAIGTLFGWWVGYVILCTAAASVLYLMLAGLVTLLRGVASWV